LREQLAVDREGRAGRHARVIRGPHDQRAQPAHFFLEQADGVIELVAAKRVAADQFRESIRLVHGCRQPGPLLVQHDVDATLGGLPGCFGARESATDDADLGAR
jgi:hypothetical protein